MDRAEIEIPHIGRKFGHCVITWRVEHFSLAACIEKTVIKGPEFKVGGPFLTRWLPTLITMVKVGEDDPALWFGLERLNTEGGPKTVCADIRLSLLDKQNVEFANIDYVYDFRCSESFSANLISMDFILEKIPAFGPDALVGKIEMLVHCEKFIHRVKQLEDADMRALSVDLGLMYQSSKFCDATIKTDDKDIGVHKAILDARCPALAKEANRTESDETSEIAKMDWEALDKVISFLYSGNLDFVLDKPSIQVYDCARYLGVDDIIAHYHPDECGLHSTVDLEEFVFVWVITNFYDRDEDCLVSPSFNKGMSSCAWRLKLYPKGFGKNVGYLSLFADVVEGFRSQSVCLEFAVLDANREMHFPKRLRKFMQNDEMLGFQSFIKSEDLEQSSVVADNTLRITFKLRSAEPSAEFVSILKSQSVSFRTVTDHHKTYFDLSNDMERVFKSGHHRDITLVAGGTEFEAHKSILVARSFRLAILIPHLRKTATKLGLSYIKASTLRMLLYYIYCGKIPSYKREELLDLYTIADDYNVYTLRDACASLLYSSLEVDNVVETMVAAKTIRGLLLTARCIRFIRKNKKDVFRHESWIAFVEANPVPARIIANPPVRRFPKKPAL